MTNLNQEQQLAVNTLHGPLLVLAGAGSGKTRVVTARIVNLIEHGVHPEQILGLTFTNKAALEMKERIRNLTNSFVTICTFHSLGARILRECITWLGYSRDFTIYDEDDVEKLLKICIGETENKIDMRKLRSLISNAKNDIDFLLNQDFNLFSHITSVQNFASIFKEYQTKLKEFNAVDYDDLLGLTVRLLKEHPPVLEWYQNKWSHLLIDEYQDTNGVQYALVEALVANHRNLCVVGDPDQSIYSWRGANIQNILNFERDYPGAVVVRLDQNYRSHGNILEAANALIQNNDNRFEKRLWSSLGPGEKIKVHRTDTEKAEALFIGEKILEHHHNGDIPLNEIVIFYRTNAQSRVLEDICLQKQIPYVIVGGLSFYQRREIKDILGWLRMIQSECDFMSFSRTINMPKRGLGATTIDKLYQGSVDANLPILTYCVKLLEGSLESQNLKLSTRHKAGLQEYISIVNSLREMIDKGKISDIVKATIEITRYKDHLEEDPETCADRLENLSALVSKAVEWQEAAVEPSLALFLEELALKSTLDETISPDEKISLMTIHNGKGLEFKVTFLAGMEEDLFPHANSRDNPEAIEEERRLCYVGITRAREVLYMTYATTRSIWGTIRAPRPSRFLSEIPQQFLEKSATSSSKPYNKFSFSYR